MMAGTRDRDSVLTSPSAANGLINLMAGFGWCPLHLSAPPPPPPPSPPSVFASALPRRCPEVALMGRAGARQPGQARLSQVAVDVERLLLLFTGHRLFLMTAHTRGSASSGDTLHCSFWSLSPPGSIFFFFFRYTMKTGSPAWIWGGVHHGKRLYEACCAYVRV